MEKKIELDEFHYHEALDRTFVFAQMLYDFLSEHPVVLEHPNVKKLVNKACETLGQAYQLIGELAYKRNKKSKK